MASDRDVLPADVKPIHYDLSLYDLQLHEPWTYQGKVDIDLEVYNATKIITFNTHQLQVRKAQVLTESGKTASSLDASDISYDRDNQRCSLTFGQDVSTSQKATLSILFEGVMNDSMAGFYRSRYQPIAEPTKGVIRDEKNHYMFSTQFEACDARRAFPCFDEPNLKATFDFAIEIPHDLVALSNMTEREATSSKREGYKVVHFERTPIMSTYLLAWAFGDFEYIEDHTRRKYNGSNLPVRVYTTRGLKEQGHLALESAHKIVDYFSEVFQIDYPLPKVDLLAVHEFSAGAMENWGLITYRTTAVLFDETASDQKYRNRVVYVVAHELAHQWFGNLVTMDWWNELWLNEGFATWVGWYAVDHLHPEWNVWAQFVTEGMQTALQLDSLRTSHPIEVQVRNALEVDQIFDSISYLKGSSVIRMLASQLGVETFLSGVAKYLNTHRYCNARTSDLWTALSRVSGQDVASFMDPWIRKIGFPVVTVAEEPGQITARQNRFLSTGDVSAEEDETVWWIPVGLKMGHDMVDQSKGALSTREDTYRQIDTDLYKLNSGQTGFYRTNLPPQRLAKLGRVLDQLSVEDKIGLVGDAGALAFSGQGTTAATLTLVKNFSNENNFLVWSEVLANLAKVRSIFTDDKKVAEGLRNFVLQLISPAVEKVGWVFDAGEDFLTGQLRSLLIATAGMAGHPNIVEEAMRRFQAHVQGDKSAIHPSLRSAVYRIAIKNGGRDAYEAVKHEVLNTTSIDGREIALAALGQVQDAALAQDYLEFGFGGKVPTQDVHIVGGSLGNNPAVRDTVWKFIKEHWAMIDDQLGDTTVILERLLRVSLQKLASSEQAQDISDFYKDKDTRRYNRGLAVVLDIIRGNAEYRKRDLGPLAEWLSEQGYC